MLFGMGTVLVFLTVLVLAIALMSWVLQRYFPVMETGADSSSPLRTPLSPVATPNSVDARLVAAITTAIHRHRSKHPRN